MAPLCVAVFAHNEEGSIRRCLESLWWATRRPEALRVRVLINGCRDATESIVRAFARTHPQVEPVVLELGDKANAWNVYTHSDPAAEANHYFLDGDTWLPPHALDVLEEEFAATDAVALAPLPLGVSESLRHFLIEHRLVCGTMYGLRGSFLRRLVGERIRMPVGFIGDDNLVASLVQSNLDEHFRDWKPERIQVVERVGPVVPRPSPLSWRAVRLGWGRLRRYALRRLQMELLEHHVRAHGLRRLPEHARELYRHWRRPGLGWYLKYRGLETPFVWRALATALWQRPGAAPPAGRDRPAVPVGEKHDL
jgi:hypothetical protein